MTTHRKLTTACPMCGKETLECQSEVAWCTNLNAANKRGCQFGMSDEKTIDDLQKATA